MEMQPECNTLLRFPALTTTEHEAVMDLDNECCPIGGRVMCQESELLSPDFVKAL